MTRKEVLLFMLREIRNEMSIALDGLSPADYAALPVEGKRNPVGWIVCHCMRGLDFFLHLTLTGRRCMDGKEKFAAFVRYADKAPGPENPPPDCTTLAGTCHELWTACIEQVEALDDNAFDRPGPHWSGRGTETVAGNCVRMINHHNAHLRAIWMIRGALGETDHYPRQNLGKRDDGTLYVPEKE